MTTTTIFLIIGILFGIIFLFLNISTFFGGDMHHDVDVNVETDMDISSDLTGDILTIRSLINFLTFFGWSGLYFTSRFDLTTTLFYSTALSLVLTIFLAAIMFLFKKLESKSTPLSKEDFVNKQGVVYLVIPGNNKKGKVQINARSGLKTIEALSETNEEIKTNSQIIVTKFINDNLVVVKEI